MAFESSELIEAEARYLEAQADQLRERAKQLRELKPEMSRPDPLEKDLEALDWKKATSGKCDYFRDAPLGLVEKVRARKGGLMGEWHHFTAANDEPTLFRFNRGPKK